MWAAGARVTRTGDARARGPVRPRARGRGARTGRAPDRLGSGALPVRARVARDQCPAACEAVPDGVPEGLPVAAPDGVPDALPDGVPEGPPDGVAPEAGAPVGP